MREVLEANAPHVVIYHLIEKGRLLRKLIDEMIQWGYLI
ncbi:MAG: winged helix-turn-helix transcriptional regulator [Bacteroidia bacterium]|nr:winged helix-turn-helix transcriptional regulator [Bacteroidia bacterium]